MQCSFFSIVWFQLDLHNCKTFFYYYYHHLQGEPSDNADAVKLAIQQMTTRELFQLSATKVTVSTVAPTPESFALFVDAPCVLAWSVHAARDDLRRRLVPTTRHTMVQLRQGLVCALNQRPPHLRATMLEVALMAGVNDSEQDADELADLARVIVDEVVGVKLIVNLIPYNDTGLGGTLFRKPDPATVVAFQKRLWARGIYAHVRTTRGDDESAACGQLATTQRQTKNQKQPSTSQVVVTTTTD